MFCTQCSERRVHRGQLGEFLRRWILTLRLLITRPGELLAHHLEGRRILYVPPLPLFLTLNLVFFVVAASAGTRILAIPLESHLSTQSYSSFARSIVDHTLERTGLAPERFVDRFEAKQSPIAKGTVILMVPVLALLLWPLMPTTQRAISSALVFSLHTFAFLLLFLSVFGPFWRGLLWVATDFHLAPTAAAQDDFLWIFFASVVATYQTLSLRRGLRLGWFRSAAVGAILTLCIGPLLLLYRLCVFLLATSSST